MKVPCNENRRGNQNYGNHDEHFDKGKSSSLVGLWLDHVMFDRKAYQPGFLICAVCAELEEEGLVANTTLICGNCADRLMAQQDFVS